MLPTAVSGIGPVPYLRRRLTMIMNRRTARRAHEEVEKLQGKSAGSRVLPSNVVPVSPR